MSLGSNISVNEILDQDTAILVIEELGHNAVAISDAREEEALIDNLRLDDG